VRANVSLDGRSFSSIANVHFAPVNFFYFFGGAKFGRFRLTSSLQVVCRPEVRKWWWGDIQSISPRGWGKILPGWGVIHHVVVERLRENLMSYVRRRAQDDPIWPRGES
jgi:hypothetical protein